MLMLVLVGRTNSEASLRMSAVICLASLLFQSRAPMITRRTNFMWKERRLLEERFLESAFNISGEDVTVAEIFYVEDFTSDGRFCNKLTNKPLIILLENTFASDAKFFAKCIKTRFCGGSLPTAIKDCHGGVINLSNFVAVKTNNRDTSFGVKVNRSVARLPVDVLLNSGTHLGFDLTHDEKEKVLVGFVSSPRWTYNRPYGVQVYN